MVAVQTLVMGIVIGLTAVSAIVTSIITCYMSRKKKMRKDENECLPDPAAVVIDKKDLNESRSDAHPSCLGTHTSNNCEDIKGNGDDTIEDSENSTVENDVVVEEVDENDKNVVGAKNAGAADVTDVADSSGVIDNSKVADASDVMDTNDVLDITKLIDNSNISDITNVINTGDAANKTNVTDISNTADVTDNHNNQ